MEARERVRRYLGGGDVDRPPFVPFATALAARLEQVPVERLLEDANLLTRALLSTQQLFALDAVVVEVPAQAKLEAVAVAGESATRLQTLLRGRAGVVLALPGPQTVAALAGAAPSDHEVDDAGARLVATASQLELQHVDCLAVIERDDVLGSALERLDDALTPLWNVARHYALPSLLVLGQADAGAAETGASALAVWSGTTPEELAAGGARRIGVPLHLDSDRPSLPAGGFYTTAGDIPAESDIDAVHRLVAAAAA